jgi:hypothetical protein
MLHEAAFTVRVTAPAHWTVLSNQPAPEAEPLDHGHAARSLGP